MKMRKPDGSYAKNDTENANVFLTHFNNLFNNLTGTDFEPAVIEEIKDGQPENEELGTLPTKREISKALKKCATKKALDRMEYQQKHTKIWKEKDLIFYLI